MSAIHRVHGPQTAQSVAKSRPAQTPVGETKSKALPEGYDGGPIRVDADHATDRQKVAGFDQIANSHTREAGAPSHVRLPPSLVATLDRLWNETRAKNQEQGGNLVRTYGGRYDTKRTHNDEDNEDSYVPDTSNVGRLDHHVGIIHTHPVEMRNSPSTSYAPGRRPSSSRAPQSSTLSSTRPTTIRKSYPSFDLR